MATTLEKIHALIDQLPPDKLELALQGIQEIINSASSKSQLPPGKPASELLSYHFSLSKEDTDAMEHAIMKDCERI
ncbi:MAG TPA: hypothetical protein DHW02_09390 [Ktedonobacter sp.]|nr:hypothetical protein [Ktedonobacter sp.]